MRKFYYDVTNEMQEPCLFHFDHDIATAIKNYTFIISIKKKNFGFKKYLLDEVINLKHL